MSANQQTVVLVDDDLDLLEEIAENLELAGNNVETYSDPVVAKNSIEKDLNIVVISDVRMPKMDGHALLDAVREIDPDIPFIMITGHGQVAQATAAMKAGAYDFLEKPIDPNQLAVVVGRALEKRSLHLQNKKLKALLNSDQLEAQIIGNSEPAKQLRQQVATLASLEVDLIIKGETGSGKDLVARCLHENSARKPHPFVAVNCGALPANLVDSAFFGHERGAFTGADTSHIGYFEAADGGTLFLDELESMPMPFQAILLRVLETREVTRLGGAKTKKLNFRVVAAVKGELSALVAAQKLRADLMYRLNVASIELAPLKQRKPDIELLFCRFAEAAAAFHNRPVPTISDQLQRKLLAYEWPGNIRELKNTAERFVIGLPLAFASNGHGNTISATGLDEAIEAFEKQKIEEALRQTAGAIGEAASLLDIPRKKLYLRMRKYGISKHFSS